MGLQIYRRKRKFDVTAEPRGRAGRAKGNLFVVQKHAARRLHYDFRLELDGVLKSWAVTKGPSSVPGEKRLAVHVEDHPLEYGGFEGTIPGGQYGGGTVMLWDRGSWTPDGDPHAGFKKGHLSFALNGEKLKGRWHLVRMRPRPKERQEAWLLIKGDDDAARGARARDILDEKTLSVATRRSLNEIAAGKKPRGRSKVKAAAGPTARSRVRPPVAASQRAAASVEVAGVRLTHPDRVYWDDAGITKRDLAQFYSEIWDWIAPHLVRRPLALLRCPDGASGTCFMQKHAHATFDRERILSVDDHGEEVIALDNLGGLVALVQAGVSEAHVWGTTIDRLDTCERLVFDLDPGPDVDWSAVIAAAREVRARLDALALQSFVKTSGGKGLHVVVPVAPAPWETAKEFARRIAFEMAADAPDTYVAKMTKSLRRGRIFVDYLRNARGATAVAAYSSRARAGAPVSTPIAWSELKPSLPPTSSRYATCASGSPASPRIRGRRSAR